MVRADMRTLILIYALAVALLSAGPAGAGIEAIPAKIEIETVTCRELLALPPESQERAIIYLTGVMDGRRRAKAFDAAVAGPAIDRLLASCQATPARAVLDAFTAAWR